MKNLTLHFKFFKLFKLNYLSDFNSNFAEFTIKHSKDTFNYTTDISELTKLLKKGF